MMRFLDWCRRCRLWVQRRYPSRRALWARVDELFAANTDLELKLRAWQAYYDAHEVQPPREHLDA